MVSSFALFVILFVYTTLVSTMWTMKSIPINAESFFHCSIRKPVATFFACKVPNNFLDCFKHIKVIYIGAGNRNRTDVFGLEGDCNTIILYPQIFN